MTTVIALLGAKALYLTYLWLFSCIVSSWLSDRKGYGEKVGLGTGLLLNFIGIFIWLVWPAKANSRWKLQGPFGRGDGRTVASARAEADAEAESEPGKA